MNHLGARTLETGRLIVRAFIPEDKNAMYRNWAGDPEVTKFLTWPTHASEEVSGRVVAAWVEENRDPERYQWAIVWKEIMEPIGSISVVEKDDIIGRAEIGYCIGKKWWNQGVMTEALTEVIRFLFEEVGFLRIEARHDINNPHSGMVMKKCGLLYEGTMRQAGKNNQGIIDYSMYAILKSDYEERKNERRNEAKGKC